MKLSTVISIYILFIALFIGSTWYNWTYDEEYNQYHNYPVEVVEKYGGQSSGKYPSATFIVVFKTNTGILFDERVSASSFYRYNKGDHLVLYRKNSEVSFDPKRRNMILFVDFIWFVSFALTFITIGLMFNSINKHFTNKETEINVNN